MKDAFVTGDALVLGLGRSGAAAARLLMSHGCRVMVVDQGTGSVEAPEGCVFIPNAKALPADPFALCVVSPGIDCESAWVKAAQQRCQTVISELELGWRYCKCPIVAVTGTNGKSTVVKLLRDMLNQAGLRAEAAGNYGLPLTAIALTQASFDWMVVEVSSFQLELVQLFRPRIGLMLNLQPDHLERHRTLEHYRWLKSRLFGAMQAGDIALVHEGEFDVVRDHAGTQVPAWLRFGETADCDARFDRLDHAVHVRLNDAGCEGRVDLQDTLFDNRVTGPSAAAAVAAACYCGLSLDQIERGLHDFVPLPHRMQCIGESGGIRYINDSKATNMSALKAAVERVAQPVRLIAGGLLKEKDIDFVKEVLKEKVLSVYLIGEAAHALESAWCAYTRCKVCGSLEKAVVAARQDAVCGDTILLAPGCASFDQFRSYADRGQCFSEFVNRLINEEKGE